MKDQVVAGVLSEQWSMKKTKLTEFHDNFISIKGKWLEQMPSGAWIPPVGAIS